MSYDGRMSCGRSNNPCKIYGHPCKGGLRELAFGIYMPDMGGQPIDADCYFSISVNERRFRNSHIGGEHDE